MRLKKLLEVPIPAKLLLLWTRITSSRVTKIYFAFSCLHCVIQVIFQVQAFNINARAADFLWTLVTRADAKDPGFAVYSGNELRFCEIVPSDFSTESCDLIWAAATAGLNNMSEEVDSTSSTATSQTAASTRATMSIFQESAAFSLTTLFVSSAPPSVSTAVTPLSTSASATTSSSPSKGDRKKEEEEKDDENESVDDDIGETDTDGVERNDDDDDDLDLHKRGHSAAFTIASIQLNGSAEVILNGFGFDNETVELTRTCLYSLNWPVEQLSNTKREDIAFIAFQIWVLGMSIVALLNESIPHIVASLMTHMLATAWGGFQIAATEEFRRNFNRMTTEGACDGVNLLSTYWSTRADVEIPSLSLNAAALLVSVFLSWKLFKLFGWQTFKRVGASRTINRVYKLVLSLSIAIQLSLFFIVVAVALWIDALCNGQIGRLSKDPSVYKAVMIIVFILLIPWLLTGWIAVRRELRISMSIFLVLSFGYTGGWGAMFVSPTFRWTFVLWRFFSLMTTASVLLTILTFILGLFCRLNFGKGLPQYLNAEEPLPDEFVPVTIEGDGEKVHFPGDQGILPTFSAAFARNTPPSQMKFGASRLGPRFTSPSLEPFETPTEGRSVQSSFSARSDPHDDLAEDSDKSNEHSRSGTITSQTSYSTYNSLDSSASGRSDRALANAFSHQKKWAIE